MTSKDNPIPDHLRDTLYMHNGVVERCEYASLHTKTKGKEFIYILENVTDTKFDQKDWYLSGEEDYDKELGGDDTTDVCVCSQSIKHLHYICHKPTMITFKVGSECVRKISEELYFYATKGACKFCGGALRKKNTYTGKKGLCSEECFAWSTYRIDFGRHRGTLIRDLPPDYVEWLYKKEGEIERMDYRMLKHVWSK